MTLLPPSLLVRLEAAIGVRAKIEPLSEGQVRRILSHWVSLRDGTSRNDELGMPPAHCSAEKPWLIWCSTVAAKVGRCPAHRVVGIPWNVPAVEALILVEWAIDGERNEIEQVKSVLRRCPNSKEQRRVNQRESDLASARNLLTALRKSREYRAGLEMLQWELAAACQDDAAFAGAIRELTTRNA